MGISAKVGTFTTGTGAAATTIVVNTVGFQPKVIIFWWNGTTATTNGQRGDCEMGMGAAVSSSSFFARSTNDTDAQGTSTCRSLRATDGCVMKIDGGSNVTGKADLQSFDANGFTLEIITQFTESRLISYLALGGDDITNANIGNFTATGTAPINQTVNNASNFQPDITFLWPGQTALTDAILAVGVATSSSDEQCYFGISDSIATTAATSTYCRAGEIIAVHPTGSGTSPTNRAEFVSHNASPGGFTINWLERATALPIDYLSIKGGAWKVGNVTTQTDTTTPISASSFGFQPAAMLFVSANKAATTQDAAPAANNECSIGAATSTSERSVMQTASRNGNTDTFCHRASRTDCVYINSDSANVSYTLEGLMDLQSVDTGGFTAIMDDADPSGAFAFYVAVGAAAVPVVPWLPHWTPSRETELVTY